MTKSATIEYKNYSLVAWISSQGECEENLFLFPPPQKNIPPLI
jgi:hypothetical protein